MSATISAENINGMSTGISQCCYTTNAPTAPIAMQDCISLPPVKKTPCGHEIQKDETWWSHAFGFQDLEQNKTVLNKKGFHNPFHSHLPKNPRHMKKGHF
jgi:hypothetical protein